MTEKAESLLLKGGDVADLLDISRALAYQWMSAGVLPTVRIAGCRSVRVPRAALLKWIEQQTENAPGVMGRSAS